jgi:Zn-dependent M32 family carboxypeptidase
MAAAAAGAPKRKKNNGKIDNTKEAHERLRVYIESKSDEWLLTLYSFALEKKEKQILFVVDRKTEQSMKLVPEDVMKAFARDEKNLAAWKKALKKDRCFVVIGLESLSQLQTFELPLNRGDAKDVQKLRALFRGL